MVVNDVDGDAAKSAAESIVAAGGLAVPHVAPVGDADVADGLVGTAVDEFGRLDVMVTNAGILRDRVLWKMTDDDFDDVVRVHLRGTFTCARAAAIRFREQGDGGRLILAGSPAGQRGNFGQTNYAACKAGITAMARTWALELAKSGVTVNCIVPTAATEMTKTIPAFAPYVEALEQRGEPLPDVAAQGRGVRHAGRRRRARRVPRLRCGGRSDGPDDRARRRPPRPVELSDRGRGRATPTAAGTPTPSPLSTRCRSVASRRPTASRRRPSRRPDVDRAVPSTSTRSSRSTCTPTPRSRRSPAAARCRPRSRRRPNEYFKVTDTQRPTVDEIADYYRQRRMMAVVFTVDATTTMGVPPVPNDEIAEAAAKNSDVLIAFGSVDPHLGRAAVREVHRLVDEHDVRGFKFHPNVQAFHPNDRMAYPVYEAIAEHGRIALFHTGQTGIGAGSPGGAGSASSTRTRWTSTTSPPTSPT